MAELDFDKLGTKLKKAQPELYRADLGWWQDAVDWVRVWLASRGYVVSRAELDPHTQRWLFYEGDVLVVAIEHALVDRLAALLWEHTKGEEADAVR